MLLLYVRGEQKDGPLSVTNIKLGIDVNQEEEKNILLSQKEKEGEEFKNYFDEFCENYLPRYDTNITRDWIYLYQDRMAFESIKMVSLNPKFRGEKLLDVGSTLYAVLFFAGLFPTTYLEPRLNDQTLHAPLTMPSLNLTFLRGEAQNIPCDDESYILLTSLHAMEHFGLGRYGDKLDYYGDQKGLKEFNRVLKSGGELILSVPASDEPRIEFNGQRVYTPEIVDDMLNSAGFKVRDRAYITSLGLNHSTDEDFIYEPISRDRKTLGLLQNRDQQAAYMVCAQKIN